MGSMSAETVSENEEYRLTIHVDDEYLASPETVYPIRIDPTIEINGNSGTNAIEDVTINSGDPNSSAPNSGTIYVGKRNSYGISRVLLRFANNTFDSIKTSLNVKSASLELRDLMCESENMVVQCYLFEGNYWYTSGSNTVCWNNTNPDRFSTLVTSKLVSYSTGAQLDNPHRYPFNIKKLWRSGSIQEIQMVLI